MQVQVLLPAPKIWRRASARLHIFRFGYGSQNLLNVAGVGNRQRLAFCKANGDFSRQDKLAAERSEAVSPVTRTKAKRTPNGVRFYFAITDAKQLPAPTKWEQ